MGDPIVSPAGPWDPDRKMFTLESGVISGTGNLAGWRRAINTKDQRMSCNVHITGYKLVSKNKSWEFYAAFGTMSHGVTGSGNNLVSVGYYSSSMSLVLDLDGHPDNTVLWDAGPTSSVGGSSTGFTIGGNLAGGVMGGEPIVQAGVSGSFGTTFSSSDVTIKTAIVGHTVRWDVLLPGVGFRSPGVPANPMGASSNGYEWAFGAIYALPIGSPWRLRVMPSISWAFDYTRGLRYDTRSWTPGGDATLFDFANA